MCLYTELDNNILLVFIWPHKIADSIVDLNMFTYVCLYVYFIYMMI